MRSPGSTSVSITIPAARQSSETGVPHKKNFSGHSLHPPAANPLGSRWRWGGDIVTDACPKASAGRASRARGAGVGS